MSSLRRLGALSHTPLPRTTSVHEGTAGSAIARGELVLVAQDKSRPFGSYAYRSHSGAGTQFNVYEMQRDRVSVLEGRVKGSGVETERWWRKSPSK